MGPASNRLFNTLQRQVFLGVVLLLVAGGVRYYMTSSEPGPTPAHDSQTKTAAKNSSQVMRMSAPEQAESTPAAGGSMVPDAQAATSKQETALGHAAKHADPTFICPMHPDIVSKDPSATCPLCGMDLVLVEDNGEADVVTISPNVINMLGVRTEQVKRRNLYRKIDTVGHVTVDENRVRNVSLRAEGWIERMHVKAEGDRVKRGQLLFELYSPKLVNAQEEFVQSLVNRNQSLMAASEERLRALGISDGQIKRLIDTRKVDQYIKVYAPQNGIVENLYFREGSFVPASKPVVTLSNLSKIWLVANIFERQADWVRENNRAVATLPFYPDKKWEGMVEYIYPSLDKKTRSLQVRMVFDNDDGLLKPNMYADVAIFARPKKKTLSIPREAMIRTGDSERVIIALGDGRFKPVRVHAGIETDSRVEILDGLNEGDEIVVSSQFLIDSESSLRASLMRMGAK